MTPSKIRKLAGLYELVGAVPMEMQRHTAEVLRACAAVVGAAKKFKSGTDWRENAKGFPLLHAALAKLEAIAP